MVTFHLGDVTISSVVEISRSSFPTASMLPDSTPEAIAAHHAWLRPAFFDEAVGDLGSRIQTFVVRTPQHTVLIDTCVGNDKNREGSALWHMRAGTYLDDLEAAGVTPAEVDYVVCTHLHVDHVGWNTRLVEGRWVPTFPRATYLFAGEEWEFWRHEKDLCIADSVVPVVEAGQAMLVDGHHAVDAWLRFEPSPGHTPGHVCVRLSTAAGEAVFTGDLMHRVVQVAEPQWSSRFCYDPKRAAETRREFVERHADSGVLVLAAHFPRPGHIVREGGGTRFVAAA
ncbi:MAG: MBL fold metallo-hydrolase [Candidatus Rokuibacteriota bacterium]|nr:MAG: MBL fold metallo-hydrolase [Candidatus Rokubacteria bacterium]